MRRVPLLFDLLESVFHRTGAAARANAEHPRDEDVRLDDIMRDLGVGIVGYGFIGKVHAWAHGSVPFFYDPLGVRANLIGVCTATEASGRKAKDQGEFRYSTTDPSDLLTDPEIDIIHCCSPNDAHHDLLAAAIAAGKHIYCDKPLTRTVEEARLIAAAADAAPTGPVRRMTFNYRFVPATMRAKQLVEEGFLGDIYQFRAAYLHAGYVDPKRPRTWRTEMARSGGGAIMDLGVHVFDLMRFLLGEFDSVHAQLETRISERPSPLTGKLEPVDVDDIAIVQTRTRSGALGVIEASRLATGVQDELRFEIHGSRGMIAFNLMEPNYLTVYDASTPEGALGADRGQQRIECVTRYPKPYSFGATKNPIGWPQLHVHCLYDFLSAIDRGDTASGPNFADGLAAQAFVDACQQSSATRAWVAFA